ncbi:exonuclease 1-like [Dioscorea cayenensis subsp. rotundata]|uniref:Exonuclease 1-like n=1 Tax=Dioscorea cayennensis subsp. rotundata TaxID=55577 RepID=A0AB40ARM1_DIOCR|nr:exonuclease 1-like [Dioscorea cayenensis subsp. rotundata]
MSSSNSSAAVAGDEVHGGSTGAEIGDGGFFSRIFKHIDYCMHRVNLLRNHNANSILGFDGAPCRRRLMKKPNVPGSYLARKENLEWALKHEAVENSFAAHECFQKAPDISPSIAWELIQVLKKENIDYVVAPYEVYAEMAFLSINKLVDAVITEGSDLIPFGCHRESNV